MKFWVIKTSEMLAEDGNRGRLLRSGLIATTLEDRGHDVTWWMSTFDHANRRQRADHDEERRFGSRGRIVMLRSPGYGRSVSPRRMLDHAVWGARFAAAAKRAPRPDAIICSYPTIESAYVASRYGRRHGVPVIVDLRDMWPDILASAAGRLEPVARLALAPWRFLAGRALRDATGLYAITEEFLDWGLAMAGRDRRADDAAFPLAYPSPDRGPDPTAEAFWDRQDVVADGTITVVFIGALNGRSYRLEPVLEAARRLAAESAPVRFVICGDGDDLPRLKELTAGCVNVVLPGWISAPQVRALLARSQLGLVPYRNTPDFLMSVPNKAAEYLSFGVPVATSLGGTLARVLAQNGCGGSYAEHSAEELLALIRSLTTDPARTAALATAARRLFEREYRAEDVYNRLAARLEGLAAVGTNAPADLRPAPSQEAR